MVSADDAAHHLGRDETDEADDAHEGDRDSGDEGGEEHAAEADFVYLNAEPFGGIFSGFEGVIVPAVVMEEDEREESGCSEDGGFFPRDATEISEGPEDHGGDLNVFGEILNEGGAGGEEGAKGYPSKHDGLGGETTETGEEEDEHHGEGGEEKGEEGD